MPNGWPTITRRQILRGLKKVIAIYKRVYEPDDILAHHTLKGKRPTGLGFSSSSLRELTMSINQAFGDVGVRLRITEVDNPGVARVHDLCVAIWKKVPPRHRKE